MMSFALLQSANRVFGHLEEVIHHHAIDFLDPAVEILFNRGVESDDIGGGANDLALDVERLG